MRMGTYYRAELIKSLGLAQSRGRILDIGGYDGFMLSQIEADQKVSVDIDTIGLHPGINYFRGDGLRLPFRDESFETIYALDVLEHVDDEQRFSQELMRVLKPGGRLILTTPQIDVQIFPKILQAWANKRWQHYRVPGYESAAVESLFEVMKPQYARVTRLSASWFLRFYLPLSLIWKLAPRTSKWLVSRIAMMDEQRQGTRGYLLAEVTK